MAHRQLKIFTVSFSPNVLGSNQHPLDLMVLKCQNIQRNSEFFLLAPRAPSLYLATRPDFLPSPLPYFGSLTHLLFLTVLAHLPFI